MIRRLLRTAGEHVVHERGVWIPVFHTLCAVPACRLTEWVHREAKVENPDMGPNANCAVLGAVAVVVNRTAIEDALDTLHTIESLFVSARNADWPNLPI